jgi:hypothetical protein
MAAGRLIQTMPFSDVAEQPAVTLSGISGRFVRKGGRHQPRFLKESLLVACCGPPGLGWQSAGAAVRHWAQRADRQALYCSFQEPIRLALPHPQHGSRINAPMGDGRQPLGRAEASMACTRMMGTDSRWVAKSSVR